MDQEESVFGDRMSRDRDDFFNRFPSRWERDDDMFFNSAPGSWSLPRARHGQPYRSMFGGAHESGWPQQSHQAPFADRMWSPPAPDSTAPSAGPGQEHIIPIHIEGRDPPRGAPSCRAPQQRATPLARNVAATAAARASSCPPPAAAAADLSHLQLHERRLPTRHASGDCSVPAATPGAAPTPAAAGASVRDGGGGGGGGVESEASRHIAAVAEEVRQLAAQVRQFDGGRGDKRHRYLDEMLTRQMLLLDDVSTAGDDRARAARRAVVLSIQETLALLESRTSGEEQCSEAAAAAECLSRSGEEQQAAPCGAGGGQEEDSAPARHTTAAPPSDTTERADPSAVSSVTQAAGQLCSDDGQDQGVDKPGACVKVPADSIAEGSSPATSNQSQSEVAGQDSPVVATADRGAADSASPDVKQGGVGTPLQDPSAEGDIVVRCSSGDQMEASGAPCHTVVCGGATDAATAATATSAAAPDE